MAKHKFLWVLIPLLLTCLGVGIYFLVKGRSRKSTAYRSPSPAALDPTGSTSAPIPDGPSFIFAEPDAPAQQGNDQPPLMQQAENDQPPPMPQQQTPEESAFAYLVTDRVPDGRPLQDFWPLRIRLERAHVHERQIELRFVNSGRAVVFVGALLHLCVSAEFHDLDVCTDPLTYFATLEHARVAQWLQVVGGGFIENTMRLFLEELRPVNAHAAPRGNPAGPEDADLATAWQSAFHRLRVQVRVSDYEYTLGEHWPLIERVYRLETSEDRAVELAFVSSGKAETFVTALLGHCQSPAFSILRVCAQVSTYLASVDHVRVRDWNSRQTWNLGETARAYLQEQHPVPAPVDEDEGGQGPECVICSRRNQPHMLFHEGAPGAAEHRYCRTCVLTLFSREDRYNCPTCRLPCRADDVLRRNAAQLAL